MMQSAFLFFASYEQSSNCLLSFVWLAENTVYNQKNNTSGQRKGSGRAKKWDILYM